MELILSASISYTGGVIGSYVDPTPASISFTLIATPTSATVTNGYLDAFSADATGQFSGTRAVAVPVPASAWGGGMLLAVLATWKWMHTRASRRSVELIPIENRNR